MTTKMSAMSFTDSSARIRLIITRVDQRLIGWSKNMLFALATLLVFQCLGEGVSYVFGLPVPGPVVGMLLLLALLVYSPRLVELVEPTALELLRHLSLLFVPAGVGIMASASTVRGDITAVALAVLVSTTLGIAATAITMRALLQRSCRAADPRDSQS